VQRPTLPHHSSRIPDRPICCARTHPATTAAACSQAAPCNLHGVVARPVPNCALQEPAGPPHAHKQRRQQLPAKPSPTHDPQGYNYGRPPFLSFPFTHTHTPPKIDPQAQAVFPATQARTTDGGTQDSTLRHVREASSESGALRKPTNRRRGWAETLHNSSCCSAVEQPLECYACFSLEQPFGCCTRSPLLNGQTVGLGLSSDLAAHTTYRTPQTDVCRNTLRNGCWQPHANRGVHAGQHALPTSVRQETPACVRHRCPTA
jgi:hypothetical protein